MFGNRDNSGNETDGTLAPNNYASRSSTSPLGDRYSFARWRASGLIRNRENIDDHHLRHSLSNRSIPA